MAGSQNEVDAIKSAYGERGSIHNEGNGLYRGSDIDASWNANRQGNGSGEGKTLEIHDPRSQGTGISGAIYLNDRREGHTKLAEVGI